MADWWLWEDEQDKWKRQAEDFGKVAQQSIQQANADLFERTAPGILGGLYQAADTATGVLSDHAQQFKDWATQQVGGGSNAQADMAGAAQSLDGNATPTPDQTVPQEADLATPTRFQRQAQQAEAHATAQEPHDDPVSKAMALLGGVGDSEPSQRPTTPENFNLGAAEQAAQNAASVGPDPEGAPGVHDIARPAVDYVAGMAHEQDATMAEYNALMDRELHGEKLSADDEQRLTQLTKDVGMGAFAGGLEGIGKLANTGLASAGRKGAREAIEVGAPGAEQALQDAVPTLMEQIGDKVRSVTGRQTPEIASSITEAGSGVTAGDSAPAMDRYYHGTGSDFAKFDPVKLDPNGLFGPAGYITDHPDVAGGVVLDQNPAMGSRGYAQQRADVSSYWSADGKLIAGSDQELQNGLKEAKTELQRAQARNDTVNESYWSDRLNRLEGASDEKRSGPNVRPIDVPRDLNLLDADAPISVKDANIIRDLVAGDTLSVPVTRPMTVAELGDFAETVIGTGDGKRELNSVLSAMGYDGIKYAGGKRIPMTAADGSPIEHNAIAIFPESLDKIRNATAGTQGGSGVLGSGRLATDLGNAATGALMGNVDETLSPQTDENGNPIERSPMEQAGRALAGGTLAVMGGRRMGRTQRTAGFAAAGVAPNGPIAQSITAPKSTGPALGDALKSLPGEIVRQMFDNTVPLRKIDEAVASLRGATPGLQDQAWKLMRLARGSAAAAEQAIEDHLGPVVHGKTDDQLANLNTYLKAQDIIDKDAVSPGHNFSGATVADAQQHIADLQQQLGAQAFSELHDGAQQVWDFGHALLKRKLDAGLISQQMYTDLTQKFPHYSPIRIIDWLDDAASGTGMQSGNKLSVGATGLKQLTEQGTDRTAEAPLDAYVRLAHETYRRSMQNEAAVAMVHNLTTLANDPQWSGVIAPANEAAAQVLGGHLGTAPGVQLNQVRPRAPGQVPFSAYINGEKLQFWLDKPLDAAINFTVPNFDQNIATKLLFGIPSQILRAGATSANALFLIPNAIGDAMTYLIRNGGIANLPETLPSLAAGWRSALTKDAAYRDLRMAGGGFAGAFGQEAGAGNKTIQDLRGLNNTVKSVLGLIPAAGERVESATRLAEYHRMLAKGATSQEAALAARDVTIDFARGGEFTKWANAFIPFFNVGYQAPAQVVRLLQAPETRGKAMAGVMSTVVLPTIGLEIYNRQDPTYADVPQSDKDRGLIMMSPWGPGPVSPETGRPTPHYFMLQLREWSPFAIAVRESMAAALGGDRSAWETAGAMLKGGSPIDPSQGLGGMVGDALPPLVKQGVEQAFNYDTFRDRPIVPDGIKNLPNDQQYTSDTSETAKLIGRATGQSPLRVQHAVTGLAAGVGRQALAAGDLALKATGATPEPSRRVAEIQRELDKTGLPEEKRAVLQHELESEQTKEQARTSSVKAVPVVGGFASSIYREQGGQIERQTGLDVDERLKQLQSTRDPMGKELARLGVTFSDVDNAIGGQQLTRRQSQEYRTKALDYRQTVLGSLLDSSVYQSADDAEKTRLVRNAMTRAAAWASQDVLPGANQTGREFLSVARGDIQQATDGYLGALRAQSEIDALGATRYAGYSGADADEIAQDRSLLSQLRNVTGSDSAGDSAFLSRYGARRFARARSARVNPAYTAGVARIERENPNLVQYLRANPLVRETPALVT